MSRVEPVRSLPYRPPSVAAPALAWRPQSHRVRRTGEPSPLHPRQIERNLLGLHRCVVALADYCQQGHGIVEQMIDRRLAGEEQPRSGYPGQGCEADPGQHESAPPLSPEERRLAYGLQLKSRLIAQRNHLLNPLRQVERHSQRLTNLPQTRAEPRLRRGTYEQIELTRHIVNREVNRFARLIEQAERLIAHDRSHASHPALRALCGVGQGLHLMGTITQGLAASPSVKPNPAQPGPPAQTPPASQGADPSLERLLRSLLGSADNYGLALQRGSANPRRMLAATLDPDLAGGLSRSVTSDQAELTALGEFFFAGGLNGRSAQGLERLLRGYPSGQYQGLIQASERVQRALDIANQPGVRQRLIHQAHEGNLGPVTQFAAELCHAVGRLLYDPEAYWRAFQPAPTEGAIPDAALQWGAKHLAGLFGSD